jgi:diguanylate cyclase (GGDEF)-like protein
MTSSVEPALAPARAPTGPRTLDFERLWVHVLRALRTDDRALDELRWASLALGTTAILAIVAKLLDPLDHGFDRAILLFVPASLLAVDAGWSPWGARLVHHPSVRLVLGPGIVGLAMIACGPVGAAQLATLALPPAAPLVVLALTYAAVTPGYPIAAAMFVVTSVLIGALHLSAVVSRGTADLLLDEFVIQAAVVLLAATGMALLVRIAADAEGRATRLAARSLARVDVLESLERIVRRFDGSRPVRAVIQDVVDDVSATFEIALVSMYLPDERGQYSMVGVAGYPNPFHVIEVGVGVIGRAAATRETQFVPDVLADPDYRAARDDVRSEVAVPIVLDEELLGIVNFEGTAERPIAPTHVALAEMLARSIAVALRVGRLDDERRDRLQAIERVLAVSRGLVGDLDRGRTMGAVVDAARDLLSADRVFVATRGDDGGFHVERDSAWLGPVAGSGGMTSLEELAALETLAANDRIITTVHGPGDDPERWVLVLPITIEQVVAAVLLASRPTSGAPFGPLELAVADLLAAQIGVALANADRHARVSDAAVRDPLTGLLNRRFFDEAVETAFATARRSGDPLSLIVLDLDRFSAVNNRHGHAVGDAVLRRVARAMREAVRDGDTVARYGGEEFVVIAPGSATDEAVIVAERIRAAVAAASSSTEAGDAAVAVTISAGVASLLGDELDGRALFRAADSALLTAKRAGRDRVVAV